MQIIHPRALTEQERHKIARPYMKNCSMPEEYSRAEVVFSTFVERNQAELEQLGEMLNKVHDERGTATH
ncbi:hypothetical protein SIID45300_01678 [Candidatus Magnetaquicoccaceae bacterium FCR-1]|uniref:Uncharacterized protein n=1 Tax=Candidatus Magnetaquiglobus chichijimensis TaxID=3141448 RepID=A0ABQ0C902_9PROT